MLAGVAAAALVKSAPVVLAAPAEEGAILPGIMDYPWQVVLLGQEGHNQVVEAEDPLLETQVHYRGAAEEVVVAEVTAAAAAVVIMAVAVAVILESYMICVAAAVVVGQVG